MLAMELSCVDTYLWSKSPTQNYVIVFALTKQEKQMQN